MQKEPRCTAALDNRPLHRSLRRIGAAPPRAGPLRYRPGATGGNDPRTPGVWGAV